MVVLPEGALAKDELYPDADAYSTSRADISFEYMGTTSTAPSASLPQLSDINDFVWTPNSYVWVGVYVENMTRLSDMMDADGLNSLVVSLLYDKTYFTWSNAYAAQSFSKINGQVAGDTITYPFSDWGYNVPHYAAAGGSTEFSSYEDLPEWVAFYPVSIPEERYSDLGVAKNTITFQESTVGSDAQKMFSGSYLTDDKTLVAMFPLQMNDVSAPSEGTKVLEGVFNSSTFSIGSGSTAYLFVRDPENDKANNLRNKFNIVNNVINLFPAKYDVTYNANGGSFAPDAETTESVAEGSHPTLNDSNGNPISDSLIAPDGKVFGGWYTDQVTQDESTAFTTNSVVTEPIEVYAKWEDGYKVTFHANAAGATLNAEGLTEKAYTVKNGEALLGVDETIADKLGLAPTREGYTFKGWYQKNGNTFTSQVTDDTLRAALPASMDVYAMWEHSDDTPGDYTLNFDKNAKDAVAGSPESITYNTGDTLNSILGGMPVEPTRANYEFLGWYTNKSGDGEKLTSSTDLSTYTNGGTITTVYAKWGYANIDDSETDNPTPKNDTVTVKFDLQSGTYKYDPLNDKYVQYNTAIENMPLDGDLTPPSGNKAFGGWYTKENGQGTKVENGTIIGSNLELPEGITIDGQGGDDVITLYANWVDQVTLTYDANGLPAEAYTALPTQDPVKPGTEVTIQNLEINDGQTYKFKGWNTEKNGSGIMYQADGKLELNENETLYAIWDYTGDDKVAVTFNVNDTTQFPATLNPNNGGQDTKQYTMYRKPGAQITFAQMPTAARAEYTFNKWDEKSNAAVVPAFDNSSYTYTVQNAATLYAIWESNPNIETDKITINFDLNDLPAGDAVLTSPESVVIDLNDSLGGRMADEPTREGYDFMGWNTSQNGDGINVTSTTVFGPGKEVAANAGETVILYAQWVQHVTVTFDPNGGDPVDPSTMELSKGANITEALPTATKTDYEFKGWNTAPNGSGTWFTDENKGDEAHKINEDTTLYAIWSYEGEDAISIVFHVNDTTQKPGTISPADDGNDKQYTIKVKPGDSLAFNNMPTATRTEYVFNRWGEKANDVVRDSFDNSTYTIEAPASGPATVDRYAIWEANPDDATTDWTVSFVLNGATTTVPASIAPIKVADGDVIGPAMPDDPTQEGYKFLGWMDITTHGDVAFEEGKKFDAATAVINQDTTLKAFWNQELQITFDENGGTVTGDSENQSLEPITVLKGESVSQRAEDPKTLPVVEKENFEFDGWYYEDENGDLVKVEDATPIEKSVELKAKWTGCAKVEFTTSEFVYNGQEQTPLTDGNITVTQTSIDGTNDVGALEGYTASMFTATYTDDEDDPVVGVPVNAGTYNIDVTLTTQKDPADKFTEFEVLTVSPIQYTILQKPVDYTIGNNYQYLANIGGKTDITVELTDPDTNPAPTIDDILQGAAGTDLSINFIKQDDNGDTADVTENTMPTAFGKYKIEITATADSNFSVGTLSEEDKAAASGEIYLYLIPTTRVIKANYGDGTVFGSTEHEEDYTTVTITTPENPSDIVNAKTTLATGGAIKVLPIEGTDFTPPTGKTIDKWVTKTTGADGEVQTDFTVDTEILYGTEPLIIYAVYKDAQWNVTFHDTKADSPATDVVYTVEATKPISADGAVRLVDGQEPAEAVTDVPTIETAPENKKFFGWATEDLSGVENLKVSDVTNTGTYANKIFTKDTLPADVLPEDSVDITVYAVYVLSDDATLSVDSVFKENNVDGITIPYVESDYTTGTTFDPNEEEHYLIASNDAENTYVEISTSQPGSTITIVKDGTSYHNQGDPSDKTATVPLDVAVDAKPNDIIVTVTAPDGTTKEYTFHIIRKAVPKFVLGYGNSPAGLIRRDLTTFASFEEQTAAIEAFNNSDEMNKTYGDGMVPIGGNAELKYVAQAWSSYDNVNYDLDPYSLFVYQATEFKDPGFKIVDELGREIELSEENKQKLSVDLTVKKQKVAGAGEYDNDDNVEDYTVQLKEGSSDTYTLYNVMVRMDVYKMNYTYQYEDLSGHITQIEATRPVIIIGRIGDVVLTTIPTVNQNDVDELKANTDSINMGNSLVAYRCMNVEFSTIPTINQNDVDKLKADTDEINQSASQYYKNID